MERRLGHGLCSLARPVARGAQLAGMNLLFPLLLALLPAHAGALDPDPSTWTVHSAQTERSTVAYWDLGVGDETVVLVHGLPTSKELWVGVAPILAQDRRVLVVDLPDFGDSSDANRSTLIHKDRARAIDAVREAAGVEHIHLVAHDLGSSVAVDYMGLYGERVERLVLMSSPVYPDFEEPAVVDLIRRPAIGIPLLNLMPGVLYRRTLHKGLVNDETLDRFQMKTYREDYRRVAGKRRMFDNLSWGVPETMFADYPRILSEIAVPTLLLHGVQDPFIPLEHAERLDADVPDSRLVLIEDGAHFLPLDVPGRVAAEVLNFLDEGGG